MNITKTFFSLGTVNTITLFSNNYNSKGAVFSEGEINTIVKKVIDRVIQIDDRMSVYKKESDVSLINEYSGIRCVQVHQDTFYVIKRSKEISQMTDGVFDITSGPLIKTWKIGQSESIPEEKEIKKALKLVNYKDIVLDEKKSTVFLKKKGQSIDLGGVGKGYAADEAARILLENNINNCIVNFGGNIIIMGEKPDGKNWKIGIQNPNSARFSTMNSLEVPNEVRYKTFVTSGGYEKYFEKDNKKYHHIMDIRTGRPSDNDILSVTIAGQSSMDSDIISTSLFVLGYEKGEKILKNMGLDGVFITKNNQMIVSRGVEKWIR